MMWPHEPVLRTCLRLPLTRRECLRLFLSGCGLGLLLPYGEVWAAEGPSGGPVLERFLGEELTYQLGFWLFPRCGEARTLLMETGEPGLYRGSLRGQTLGLVDWIAGQYRFTYVSYMTASRAADRFRPHHFFLSVWRSGKERRSTVRFDYLKGEILFSRTRADGDRIQQKEAMKAGVSYEDYMSLFYNFRNGCYGPLKRGRTYHLPIHVHRGMKSLEVTIASPEEEEAQRKRESRTRGKDFFLRFRVNREDVSSETGEIEGWLSSDGVPVKGTIKDVLFFGDLWGELVRRRVGNRRGVDTGISLRASNDTFSEAL